MEEKEEGGEDDVTTRCDLQTLPILLLQVYPFRYVPQSMRAMRPPSMTKMLPGWGSVGRRKGGREGGKEEKKKI